MKNDGETKKPKAVILLSGGLDSTTTLALTRRDGYECYCLSFIYGQRQNVEVELAKKSAEQLGCKEHLILNLGLDKIGGSALTTNLDVPKDRTPEEMVSTIPITYVPGRNMIFLAYAVAWAEVIGARDIFIGVNALDYSGYPDCRPEFIESFNKTANLGTRAGIEGGGNFTVHAPLIGMTKGEIIKKGMDLGVDFSLTLSCYDPGKSGTACGLCDSCKLRQKGFSEAGFDDPVAYEGHV